MSSSSSSGPIIWKSVKPLFKKRDTVKVNQSARMDHRNNEPGRTDRDYEWWDSTHKITDIERRNGWWWYTLDKRGFPYEIIVREDGLTLVSRFTNGSSSSSNDNNNSGSGNRTRLTSFDFFHEPSNNGSGNPQFRVEDRVKVNKGARMDHQNNGSEDIDNDDDDWWGAVLRVIDREIRNGWWWYTLRGRLYPYDIIVREDGLQLINRDTNNSSSSANDNNNNQKKSNAEDMIKVGQIWEENKQRQKIRIARNHPPTSTVAVIDLHNNINNKTYGMSYEKLLKNYHLLKDDEFEVEKTKTVEEQLDEEYQEALKNGEVVDLYSDENNNNNNDYKDGASMSTTTTTSRSQKKRKRVKQEVTTKHIYSAKFGEQTGRDHIYLRQRVTARITVWLFHMGKVDKLNYDLIPGFVMKLEAIHFRNSNSLQEYAPDGNAPDGRNIFYRAMNRVYKEYYESEEGAYFRDRIEKPSFMSTPENSLLSNFGNLTL